MAWISSPLRPALQTGERPPYSPSFLIYGVSKTSRAHGKAHSYLSKHCSLEYEAIHKELTAEVTGVGVVPDTAGTALILSRNSGS